MKRLAYTAISKTLPFLAPRLKRTWTWDEPIRAQIKVQKTGNEQSFFDNAVITEIRNYAFVVIAAMVMAYLIVNTGFLIPVICMGIVSIFVFIFKINRDIRWGFYLLMGTSFAIAGLSRYISLPLGLMIDFILLILFAVFFLKKFRSISWEGLRNPVFIVVTVWMLLNILELANIEARSFEAWFYAMRGVALYFFLTLLVGYLCLHHKTDFKWFITLWFLFSIIGTLWGMKQLFIGLDANEKEWLSVPGNLSTHLLFGKLRVFSFYSDAGQFGASQAHTALVACILSVFEKSRGRKLFYILTTLLCTYGMVVSGTRGALAILVIGFFSYMMLVKNFKVILIGSTILFLLFSLLKFTFIGQGNADIGRLRTSLDPNNPSLLVRKENQKKLAVYLDDHWCGGGVGSGGYWGQRFSPDTFLANLALDSWYVRIAAEYGYIGLILYIMMMMFIVYMAYKKISKEFDPLIRNQLMAIFCGLTGILVASYTNQVFGQMPTGIIMYLSIVFLTQKDTEIKPNHEAAIS